VRKSNDDWATEQGIVQKGKQGEKVSRKERKKKVKKEGTGRKQQMMRTKVKEESKTCTNTHANMHFCVYTCI